MDYYNELVKFTEKYSGESFCNSFWLKEDENYFEDWLYDNTPEEIIEYSKYVKVFANADGTGARYAFWFKDGNTDKNIVPIIFYGSEGDITVIAENIKSLIRMLSFGAEGVGMSHYIENEDFDDDFDYYKSFLEYTPNFEIFRKWMQDTLNIEPVSIDGLISGKCEYSDEIEEMQEIAVSEFKKQFDDWQYQFYPNLEAEQIADRAKFKKRYLK